jgi:predicted GIY-YIG superfamily endonuclease
MTVYLLHFSRKLSGHAKHYIGSAANLEGRLWHHRHASGACITRAAVRPGIKLILARTWQAERSFELKLKRQKHAERYCPLCNCSRRPH